MHIDSVLHADSPLVQDEASKIGCEALFNTKQHSDASRVKARTEYHRDRLVLQIENDGSGIDPEAPLIVELSVDGFRPF